MNYPIRIIIVEDHFLFRVGITSILSSVKDKYEVVAEAGTVSEFYALKNKTEADLLLLDIRLPDGNGIDIGRRLYEEKSALKILVLSAESDAATITSLLETGINGFISKNAPSQELFTAIDYIMDGGEYFGKDISKLIRDIKVSKKNAKEPFTDRENEIIALCSQGLTAKEIAEKMHINVATVNTHKNNIFKKLGINNSVELVIYAIKAGIITL